MTRLSAQSERSFVRASMGGSRHVLVTIGAPALEGARPRLPMNLAFVLDRSGSMGRGKLNLAKGAVVEGIRRLTRGDRFAVVAYDGDVDVTVASTPASGENIARARNSIGALFARGSTALYDGWLTGCKEVESHLNDGQVARCMLFTDGQANQGETSADVLANRAAELRARGITTSTFGIGLDFDEVLLRRMADEGGGNARFIESDADFSKLVSAELRDTLDIVHRSLVLRIEAPSGVAVEVIGPWRTERTDAGADVLLGDVVSEELLDVVVRFRLPHGHRRDVTGVTFSLLDREGPVDATPAQVEWRYVGGEENDVQPREVEVDRAVAARHAARARERAVIANREGRYDVAAGLLLGVVAQIERYAGKDPELLALIESLRSDVQSYGEPMTAREVKIAYSRNSSAVRSRMEDGSARRR